MPALIETSALTAENGGHGSQGFIMRPANCDDDIGDDADGAGDFNGDGWPDLVFGAYDPEEAHLLYGRPEAFAPEISIASLELGDGSLGFTMKGRSSDHTGISVSGVGDVNADGRDDMLIGAGQVGPGQNLGAGGAWLLFGTADPFPPRFEMDTLRPSAGGDGTAGVLFLNSFPGAFDTGANVAGIGDVNGDGVNDFAMTSLRTTGLNASTTNVLVVFGRRASAAPAD